MKKLITILFTISLMLGFAACNGEGEPEIITTEQPPTTRENLNVNDPEPEPIETDLSAVTEALRENFDNIKIDGSTSMLPLHQSLRDLLSSSTYGEYDNVQHSKTVDAFEKLISGENDILFGVDYNEELLSKAANAGIDLQKLSITREAFVFVMNTSNPIKDLTSGQIKAIYSGEITNWSDIGGDDEEIIAYQRNANSGSQIRMNLFMGDMPLMTANVEYINEMGGVVERVGSMELGKYTLAYNMYTFTEKQYYNENVQFLAVDGVKPSDETIFNESYPLVIYNYMYYDANNAAATEFAGLLYEYLMSDEGQKLIAEAGYVNLNSDTKRNLANARDFLSLLQRSNLMYVSYNVWLYEGVIGVRPTPSTAFQEIDLFNFRFEGKYYNYLYYNINEDKYFLTIYDSSYIEKYPGQFTMYTDYVGDIAEIEIEITYEDLSKIYALEKQIATIDGEIVFNYWDKLDIVEIEIMYYQLFD